MNEEAKIPSVSYELRQEVVDFTGTNYEQPKPTFSIFVLKEC
jgi:hypothetical protein